MARNGVDSRRGNTKRKVKAELARWGHADLKEMNPRRIVAHDRIQWKGMT